MAKSTTFVLSLIYRYWILWTVLVLAVITFLSLYPLERLPTVPGNDKTHHLIAYAALMLPTAVRRPRYWLFLGLGFIAYSGLIELLQPLSNRYAEWLDLLANSCGVIIGAVLGKTFSTNKRQP